ncbi:MAG: hypothetical protein KZQ89_09190 [Candidatus Thiodiazotropha sp. (ex Lucinoma kastoroae)]|nr:hypothetical protein [Candidatus Thiodiazotropha sp. (ex Lucinoma kastoroae)]
MSYQSDLADSDERLFEEEDDRYVDRVSGISGYLLLVSQQFEFSFELVAATDFFSGTGKASKPTDGMER